MKIRDADGVVFDLPRHVATGLARSASNTFELVVDEPEDTDAEATAKAKPARKAAAPPPPADPAEAPTSAWTNARITTWAKDHGVDLGVATKKEDMLAAITAASIARTAAALDAALTPAGQTPLIVDEAAPATEDDDEPDEAADDVAAPLADDEDDNLEPDDPEPEDDQSAGKD